MSTKNQAGSTNDLLPSFHPKQAEDIILKLILDSNAAFIFLNTFIYNTQLTLFRAIITSSGELATFALIHNRGIVLHGDHDT